MSRWTRVAAISSLCLMFLTGTSVAAPRPSGRLAAPAPPSGLQLVAQPPMVDVGFDVLFTLTAKKWPAPATATLGFVSPHHGFTGQMTWEKDCGCFRLAVTLARRIHPLEQARATVVVRSGTTRVSVVATFLIRGLAPNGRDFAPGGPPSLTAWVSDPSPLPLEFQHYCAWVKTADGLGVAGQNVKIVAHFRQGPRTWSAGPTGKSGVVCTDKSIGHAHPGYRIVVDVYAAGLHARTQFTPRP